MRKQGYAAVGIAGLAVAAGVALFAGAGLRAQPGAIPIVISSAFPSELNPPYSPAAGQTGGAPQATPEQAAAFAWQEFIALNWPAGPQTGQPGQRDTPSTTLAFGAQTYSGPLVWETFRGKVEIFPGVPFPNNSTVPPGYPGPPGDASFGYDATPVYQYGQPVPACNATQASDPTPWVNLDETDQITLDNMYAGVAATADPGGDSQPQLIRFLAKANRSEYVYVAKNSDPTNPNKQWWTQIPSDVVTATKAYLAKYQKSPPPGADKWVSQPFGTTEVKAGWRPLTAKEIAGGRFHMQRVRFYEVNSSSTTCYIDATWGLVALHIIQKTPSAPYFIYATFEQADNLLTEKGDRVEDADGRILLPPPVNATSPQVCLKDPQPPMSPPPPVEKTSALGTVILTGNPAKCLPAPATYCTSPGKRLYYRNAAIPPPNNAPSGGNICVNRRDNAIPDYAIAANAAAHAAMAAYFKKNGITGAPWPYYKLVNVQYYPYDKIPVPGAPNGSIYTRAPPYSAKHPAPSSYYQANIVVETNRALQLFSGGLSPNISTDWNADGTPHKNSYYNGHFYNQGGCMGCHGSQGQNPAGQAGDFSVILARGTVAQPEPPQVQTQGAALVVRNRSLVR